MAVSPFSASTSGGSAGARSRDVNLADARHGGALGDVGRQQAEGLPFRCGVDRLPDRVSPGAARRERRLVAKRALVPLEGGEDNPALLGLVAVGGQETGQGGAVPAL